MTFPKRMHIPDDRKLMVSLLLMPCGFVISSGARAAELGSGGTTPPGARISGKVSARGSYDMPPRLRVFKNRKFCGDTVSNEALLIGPGSELRNAVVTLTPTDRLATAPPRPVVLDNRRCAFVPHVQVATLGSDLLLKNSDPILHTVHARLSKETLFNLGLPTWRQVVRRLDRPGVMRIDCDVLHTWMSAVIVVVTTPYFMVTDANGTFAMDSLPPGNYRVDVWHERLGLKQLRVDLLENRPFSLEVSFSGAVRRVDDLCAVC
jgi:hypothetical protein